MSNQIIEVIRMSVFEFNLSELRYMHLFGKMHVGSKY